MTGSFKRSKLLCHVKSTLSSSWFFYTASYFLLLIIIVVKNPCLYIHPRFIVDDSLLFQYYFNHRSFNDFFYFWAGYFSLFPNIFVKLFVATVPLTWIPRAFALLSLLTKTTATWMFCLSPFSIFIPNRFVRLIVTVLLAIQPISHWTLDSGLMGYQHWNLLLIVFFALLIEPSVSDKTWCFITLVIIMFICSTPVSIIFLPIFLVRGIRALQNRKIVRFSAYCMVSVCAVIYIYFGMVKITMEGGPATQKHIVPDFQNIIRVGLGESFQRIVMDSFLPPAFRIITSDISPWLSLLLSVIIFIAVCALVLKASKRSSSLANLTVLASYVAGSITLSVIARKPVSDYFIYHEGGHRYFYVQHFLLLLLTSISVYQLTLCWDRRKKLALTVLVLLAASFFAYIGNYRYRYSCKYQEYQDAVESGKLDELFLTRDLCSPGIKVEKCLEGLSRMMAATGVDGDIEGYVSCDEIEPPIRLNAYKRAGKNPGTTENR